ncbi:MAG: hypothetical protein CL677_00105 [Bdellovibrionaceae bacterium]|nr:hypothetical protein [Pseudobdellovibrionaceae bacterium]
MKYQQILIFIFFCTFFCYMLPQAYSENPSSGYSEALKSLCVQQITERQFPIQCFEWADKMPSKANSEHLKREANAQCLNLNSSELLAFYALEKHRSFIPKPCWKHWKKAVEDYRYKTRKF